MPNIFDYNDYRIFLNDYYNERKRSNYYFSIRFIGKQVGMDPGLLVKVFQQQRHITKDHVPKFIRLCKFNKREAEYFENLVAFSKAKSERETALYFEKFLRLRSVGVKKVEAAQYEYYKQWYYSAIRLLLDFYRFDGDFTSLAKKLSPNISRKQAEEAIDLLQAVQLIKPDSGGRLHPVDAVLTTGENWHSLAVRHFQRETMRLAMESLDRHPKEDRDISTVGITIAQKDLPAIKTMIQDFRYSILEFAAQSTNADSVYQLNVQLFPLTENGARKKS